MTEKDTVVQNPSAEPGRLRTNEEEKPSRVQQGRAGGAWSGTRDKASEKAPICSVTRKFRVQAQAADRSGGERCDMQRRPDIGQVKSVPRSHCTQLPIASLSSQTFCVSQ